MLITSPVSRIAAGSVVVAVSMVIVVSVVTAVSVVITVSIPSSGVPSRAKIAAV